MFSRREPPPNTQSSPTGFAIAFFSKDFTNIQISYLYRGSLTNPEDVLKKGFTARGTNPDVLSHILNNDGSFVSTSTSKNTFKKFPQKIENGTAFLYEINIPEHVAPTQDVLQEALKKGVLTQEKYEVFLAEKEIAIPAHIKPQDIKGVWQVNISKQPVTSDSPLYSALFENITVRAIDGPFIPNPDYIPSTKTLLVASQALKAIKYTIHGGLTGVGVALDGLSLYQAYQEYSASGKYNTFFREGARIMAGWSGALALGTSFAKAAAVTTAPLTPIMPYGPPVFGFIGGIIGSIVGYTAGSYMVTSVDTDDFVNFIPRAHGGELESNPLVDFSLNLHQLRQPQVQRLCQIWKSSLPSEHPFAKVIQMTMHSPYQKFDYFSEHNAYLNLIRQCPQVATGMEIILEEAKALAFSSSHYYQGTYRARDSLNEALKKMAAYSLEEAIKKDPTLSSFALAQSSSLLPIKKAVATEKTIFETIANSVANVVNGIPTVYEYCSDLLFTPAAAADLSQEDQTQRDAVVARTVDHFYQESISLLAQLPKDGLILEQDGACQGK